MFMFDCFPLLHSKFSSKKAKLMMHINRPFFEIYLFVYDVSTIENILDSM